MKTDFFKTGNRQYLLVLTVVTVVIILILGFLIYALNSFSLFPQEPKLIKHINPEGEEVYYNPKYFTEEDIKRLDDEPEAPHEDGEPIEPLESPGPTIIIDG